MSAVNSPCQGCTKRHVGCHNVETCDGWRQYVEAQKVRKERYLKEQDAIGVHARRARLISKQQQLGAKIYE